MVDEIVDLDELSEGGVGRPVGFAAYSRPFDPSALTWPPTLPLEIALRTAPMSAIREAYGYTEEQWEALRESPVFLKELAVAIETLKEDGMSFRTKARLQAEELLATSWQMIHDAASPAAVRADLIKFTVRAAGLDGSKDQAAQGPGVAMQINIALD